MRRDRRVELGFAVAVQGGERARLVGRHQPGITHHIREKDGGKATNLSIWLHARQHSLP